MKKVLVFGTFDIFHEGHRNFFKQARGHGDFLQVVVARDKNVLKVKGKSPIFSENERVETIRKSCLVDGAVLGDLRDRFRTIKDFKPDIICMGYDQNPVDSELRKKLDKLGFGKTKIVRLKSFEPEKYKSSILRKKLEKK